MENLQPVAILVRVSTNRQETDRQVSELTSYAESKGYNVVEICSETISGAADQNHREGLTRIEELAREGRISKVLVHEVSRLARKNSIAHHFLETLEELKVSLYWHQQGIETLLPNGKRNPAASLMFSLLAEMARAERETISERIRSGLSEAVKHGKTLGRPKGSNLRTDEFLKKHRDVVKLLNQDFSIRNAAKISGKSISTVQRVKKAIHRPQLVS